MLLISRFESKSLVLRWLINWLWNKCLQIGQSECDSKFLIEINVVIWPTEVHLIDGFHLWGTETSRQLIQGFTVVIAQDPIKNLVPLFFFFYGQTRAEQHNEAKKFHLGMSHCDLHKHNLLHKQPLLPQFTLPFSWNQIILRGILHFPFLHRDSHKDNLKSFAGTSSLLRSTMGESSNALSIFILQSPVVSVSTLACNLQQSE